MYKTLKPFIQKELDSIREAGLYKKERVITTPQGADIRTADGKEVINFCANNYLGLSSHPRVLAAAKKAIDTHGYGMSSVRFICGTQDIHKELERKISEFLGTEDTILYAAAFDANGGVFEPLLGAEDAIISDELNHASIIDGVRLCKAARHRFKHNDMDDLQRQLEEIRKAGSKQIMIVTDGAFSMDGTIAQLDKICDLADRYEALLTRSRGISSPTAKVRRPCWTRPCATAVNGWTRRSPWRCSKPTACPCCAVSTRTMWKTRSARPG